MRWSDAVFGRNAHPKPVGRRRAAAAMRTAAALDQLVDTQLPLLTGLPEDARGRAAEHLAELVMLAQSYRQYAQGWIARRELDRRARRAVTRLGKVPTSPGAR